MCAIVYRVCNYPMFHWCVSFDSVLILQQCKINSGLFPDVYHIYSTFTICNIFLSES